MTHQPGGTRVDAGHPVAYTRALLRVGAAVALRVAEVFEQRAATLVAMGAPEARVRAVREYADRERCLAREWMADS